MKEIAPAIAVTEESAPPAPAETLSLVIPVYGNEENIADLVPAMEGLNDTLGGRLEVVFVIDGSPDRSGELLLAARPGFGFRSRILFHSRNFGSFIAIRTGLEAATGPYFAVMAADLQEPPELVAQFFEVLEADEADIVFGTRKSRNDSAVRDLLSRSFWSVYRRMVMRDVPRGGVDVFACNRAVRDTVLSIEEPNSSLVAQLFWIGYRRAFVPYDRQQRVAGKSGWSLARRFRYLMDSILSFSDLPILAVLWIGIFGCLVSLAFAFYVVVARLMNVIQEPGYTSIILLVAFFGSINMLVQGIIGCYLWRTFENSKNRPLSIVSRVVG